MKPLLRPAPDQLLEGRGVALGKLPHVGVLVAGRFHEDRLRADELEMKSAVKPARHDDEDGQAGLQVKHGRGRVRPGRMPEKDGLDTFRGARVLVDDQRH